MKVTLKDLNNKIDYLNDITNNNRKAYEFGKGSNVGTYYLSMAYGGHKLEQIVNTRGGCKDVLCTGFTTKKDLYYNICSYISGIENQ
tara:strand:- start:337 stop:597 length:261 start_codon:yes stop_codon:yes gene_type:complete